MWQLQKTNLTLGDRGPMELHSWKEVDAQILFLDSDKKS